MDLRGIPGLGRFIRIPLFVGQLNIKWRRDAWVSERFGMTPTLWLGPIIIVWRKWR